MKRSNLMWLCNLNKYVTYRDNASGSTKTCAWAFSITGHRLALVSFDMAPIIYTSPLPSIPLYAHSIFTHLFSSSGPHEINGFSASLPAFIDAITGTTITRGQLKQLALALGYGLQNHPVLSAKRGDTVMIYSPNSLAWPVVIFGSGKILYFKL